MRGSNGPRPSRCARAGDSRRGARRDRELLYRAYRCPYPALRGYSELVAELGRRGVAMAVASNKFQTGTEKLIRLFFPGVAFAAVFGQRPDVPLKPDPAVVEEKILALTGVARRGALWGFGRGHRDRGGCGRPLGGRDGASATAQNSSLPELCTSSTVRRSCCWGCCNRAARNRMECVPATAAPKSRFLNGI